MDFHNFYKYELSLDDIRCLKFILVDYLRDLYFSDISSRRIQDFVFMLLRSGLSENETLNVLIESLFYIPRMDILYECSIKYCDDQYQFGKLISSTRVLLFKLFNEFDEKDFENSLTVLLSGTDIKNKSTLEKLNLIHDSMVDNKKFDAILEYFKNYGNDKSKKLVENFKNQQITDDKSEQLWLKVSNDFHDVKKTDEIILALEKGDESANPKFAFCDCGKMKIIDYQKNNSYDIPEDDEVKSVCLIFDINKYEGNTRKGSEKDTKRIRKIFEKLHFTIQVYENVSKEDMLQTAKIFADVDPKKAGSMLVCFILAHGLKDVVLDVNGDAVNIRQFSLVFSAKNCIAYRNKPKIFFIQACQGVRFHEGIPESSLDVESSQYSIPESVLTNSKPKIEEYTKSDMIPEEADFIYGLATVSDYVAFRSTKKGSWYITELCRKIKQDVNKADIISILISVNHEVSQKSYKNTCQLPSVNFTSRKKCFLARQVNV